MKRIAIQGEPGCYHDAAARAFFSDEEVETIPCPTFEALFEALASDPSLLGTVAIENTIAGPLLANHELMRRGKSLIAGELKMRISHVVCALPGQKLEDISEINSHPMALMQCGDFLNRHPWLKAVERPDTAGSAKEISEGNLEGHAAICGEFAAGLYGLEILRKGVETNPHNFTRFLLLARPETGIMAPEPDKATMIFTLPHEQGALSKVLAILSFYDLNLTKIQSTPIVGREWEYRFYIDVTFNNFERYRQAIEAIRPLTSELAEAGVYAEAKTVF